MRELKVPSPSPNSSSKEKEWKKEMDEPTESSSSTFNSCGLSTATTSAAPPSYPLNRSSFHSSFQHVQLTIEPEPHHWQPLTSFSRTTPPRNLNHFLIHISDPSKGN